MKEKDGSSYSDLQKGIPVLHCILLSRKDAPNFQANTKIGYMIGVRTLTHRGYDTGKICEIKIMLGSRDRWQPVYYMWRENSITYLAVALPAMTVPPWNTCQYTKRRINPVAVEWAF